MNTPNEERNSRILVIDDNRAIHDDFRKILVGDTGNAALDQMSAALFDQPAKPQTSLEFRVDCANQGEEALWLVQQSLQAAQPYAMAFVDVRMPPGWDGVETVLKLWEVDPDLQVVICTAYADYSWDDLIQKLGHSDRFVILKKPFDSVEVLQLAYALTEKWHLLHLNKSKLDDLERMVSTRTAELKSTNEKLRAEVAERKRAEEKLGFKNIILSTQQEASIEGILVVDENGGIISSNRRFVDMWGIPFDVAESKSDERALQSVIDNLASPEEFIRKVKHVYEARYETSRDEIALKDGRVFDRYSAPMLGAGGKYYGRVWYFRDITEHKRAAEELRKAEERFRVAAETSNDAVYEWDLKQSVQWFGKIDEMLGYDPDEFPRTLDGWAASVHPEDRERVMAAVQAHLEGHAAFAAEYRVRRKDGVYRWWAARGVAVRMPDGKPFRWIGTVTDITERKRLEEQLLQSQKVESIGRLAGGVAHDFNNLLTAITGHSILLMKGLDSNNPLRNSAEQIEQAAYRAGRLTRQLLAFSRKQVMQPKVLNLNAVVADMAKMSQRLIGEDVELVTIPADSLWSIKADPGQIEQVILNLALNARDAMPDGGKLTIQTVNVILDEDYAHHHADVKTGEFVMLAISDTGTGVTDEVKAHMFEPFFTTKDQGKGTGLGLATCFGIVNQSGGRINVYSELGHGTTFKIYLPRVEQAAEEIVTRKVIGPVPRGTETILLVEDEEIVRDLAALVLTDLGYAVLLAGNGVEALSMAAQRNGEGLDLVVTDVVMPQMGGRDLADRLGALYPHTRVLFTSGYTNDAIVQHGMLEPGIAFLQKPYTPSALAYKVRAVLDGKNGSGNESHPLWSEASDTPVCV